MWDTEYNDDSQFADTNSDFFEAGDYEYGEGYNQSTGGATSGEDNGYKSQHGSSAPIAGWIAQGFANATAYYGAWREGEQQNDYYKKQMELTYREKQIFLRKFENDYSAVKQDAADAKNDVQNIARFNEIKEKKYQEDSDSGISAMMARTAKSGVAMDFGSPLEYMGKIVDDRAEQFSMLKYGGEVEKYKQERRAANLSDKATIMLDEAKTQMKNYDYQATMFLRSAGDAVKAARYKSYQAALNI